MQPEGLYDQHSRCKNVKKHTNQLFVELSAI